MRKLVLTALNTVMLVAFASLAFADDGTSVGFGSFTSSPIPRAKR